MVSTEPSPTSQPPPSSPTPGGFVNPPSTMIEYVCPSRATFIANLTLEEYMPIAAVSRQRQCKSNLKASHKRVVEWALKHAESNPTKGVKFDYRFAADKDFGRMTSNSMMGIPRDIRGFVCVDEHIQEPVLTDLDMDNCHPTNLGVGHQKTRHHVPTNLRI